MSDLKSFIVGLILLAGLFLPLTNSQHPNIFDNDQVDRLFEMNKCFQGGQIPCRFIPDVGNRYGYPLFNYYAPLPYYGGEVFYILTGSFTLAGRMMLVTVFLGTYFWGFILLRKRWGNVAGFLLSLIYTFFSYYLVVFLIKGTIDEMWTLMLLPTLFWSLLRLKNSTTIFNLLMVAFSSFLLIISHNLGTFLFVPLYLLFSTILLVSKKDLRFFKLAYFSLILGLLTAAFYWLPMLAEREVVNWNDQIKHSIVDFIPVYSEGTNFNKIPPRYEIVTGESEIVNYQAGMNRISFIATAKTHSIIRLSVYYFPLWQVMVDGKEVKIDYKNNLGLITFILGQGTHQVEATLLESPVRMLANLMTVVGFLITVILLLSQFPKTRKWIFYYIHSFNR